MSKFKTEIDTREIEYSLKDTDDKILLNLRELGYKLYTLYDGKASQRRAIILLLNSGGMSQRELTDRLLIRPASMSEIIAKLLGKNLIIRTPLKTDKRTSFITLTEEGKRYAINAIIERTEKREELFAPLSTDEREQLLTLLEKMV